MWFLSISAQTAIISQGSMNRLIFTIGTSCVYCAVRAEYLHIIEVILSLKGLKTILGLIDSVLLIVIVIYYTLLWQLSLEYNKYNVMQTSLLNRSVVRAFLFLWRIRKNSEKRLLASSCMSVRLSVRQHISPRLPLDGFLWNLYCGLYENLSIKSRFG